MWSLSPQPTHRVVLRYIELETGHIGDGPAWIARVATTDSGGQLYFNRRAFLRLEGSRYMDVESYQVYRIERLRNEDGTRRRDGLPIKIEHAAVSHYLRRTGLAQLDPRRFHVIPDLPQTNTAAFHTFACRPSIMEPRTAFPNTLRPF
ncbi:MAG TPA: hypothetical protein VGN52_05460 [Burkholderiales bacterium]